jgi:hypothetical protein
MRFNQIKCGKSIKYNFAFCVARLQERREPLIHFQPLSAKQVAHVPFNVTLYRRKGKCCPTLRCSDGHLKWKYLWPSAATLGYKRRKIKVKIELLYSGLKFRWAIQKLFWPPNFPSFSCGPLESWRGPLRGHNHFENHWYSDLLSTMAVLGSSARSAFSVPEMTFLI